MGCRVWSVGCWLLGVGLRITVEGLGFGVGIQGFGFSDEAEPQEAPPRPRTCWCQHKSSATVKPGELTVDEWSVATVLFAQKFACRIEGSRAF